MTRHRPPPRTFAWHLLHGFSTACVITYNATVATMVWLRDVRARLSHVKR